MKTLHETLRSGIDWPAIEGNRLPLRQAREMTLVGSGQPAAAAEPLARCGYAMIDDLETPRLRGMLAQMERFQAAYMAATRPLWKDSFEHTGDRLDNWSRRWEYPYCAWNLGDLEPGRVLDAGSGINFFPFFLEQAGWDVTCCDLNGGLYPVFEEANRLLGTHVAFRGAPIEALPFKSGAFDALYCVSVLEHAPQRVHAMDEFARVLAPGGRLTITWDVSLSRDCDVKLEDVAELLVQLEERFEPVHPIDLMRPSNLLTTERMLDGERWRLSWRPHRQWWRRAITRLLHGNPYRALAVMGTTWKKRG